MAEKDTRNYLSEGILLAAIPFVGTGVALIFERGYLSYYEVPPSVIQLDITTILVGSVAVVLGISVYAVVFLFFGLMFGAKPFWRAIAEASILPLLFAPLVILTGDEFAWPRLALVFFALLFLTLLSAAFSKKKDLNFETRLGQVLDDQSSFRSGVKSGPQIFMSIVAVALLLLIPFGYIFLYGSWVASNRSTYWVKTADPSWLYVASYSDTLVFKKYNPATNELEDEVSLSKLDTSGLTLKRDLRLKPPREVQVRDAKNRQLPGDPLADFARWRAQRASEVTPPSPSK